MTPWLSHICGTNPATLLGMELALTVGDQQAALSRPCPSCSGRNLEHWCPADGRLYSLAVVRKVPPRLLLPLWKATVSAACPSCGIVIDLANTVANDAQATRQEQAAADEVKNGAMAIGSLVAVLGFLGWGFNGGGGAKS